MPTILFRMLSTLAAAAQTADRIDYWIRRHVIEYWDETHPSLNSSWIPVEIDASGCQQLDNVAAENKCLARSTKTRTGFPATKKREIRARPTPEVSISYAQTFLTRS